MHYSYVSACHDFTHLASQWLFLGATCDDLEPFHLHRNQLNFCTHHCTTGLLGINFLWTCLVTFGKAYWEITLVVTFFLIVTFSIIVPEICKMCNL